MKTFQLTFTDGTKIQIEVEDSKSAELFVDDEKITITFAGDFKQNEKSDYKVTQIEDASDITKERTKGASEQFEIEGILRACCRYNGRRYCITGACAWMPCGYICG